MSASERLVMKIDAERLRGFLDCMHEEADERDKRSAQIREIVKAAKDAGYDTKAIRKVFTRERMDEAERSRQDDLLTTYEHALGGKGRALAAIRAGVPVGEAAAANGVHRATLARARHGNSHVAKQPSNATPHDPDTGEITETADLDTPPGAVAGTDDVTSIPGSDRADPTPPGKEALEGEEARQGDKSCGPVFTPRMALNQLGSDDRPGAEVKARISRASVSTDGGASRDTGTEQISDLCAGRSAASPQSPPQFNVCSTNPLPMQREIGAVAEEVAVQSSGEVGQLPSTCKESLQVEDGLEILPFLDRRKNKGLAPASPAHRRCSDRSEGTQ